MAESIISPGIRPESPVSMTLVDDQTQVFQPQFGRGRTQRQVYGDPRWRMRMRFRGMRDHERARLRMAIAEARGKGTALRVTPYQTRRGSFPTSELLTQSTEFTSTSGYTATDCALTVVDRMLRLTVTENDGSQSANFYQTTPPVMVSGAPYAYRTAYMAPSEPNFTFGHYYGSFGGVTDYGTGGDYLWTSLDVPVVDTAPVPVFYKIPGHKAGDYVTIPYQSVSRCAVVDLSPNLLLQSEDLATTWTTNSATVSSNVTTDPRGGSTADKITASAATNNHYITQSVTVASSQADFTISVALKAAGYNYAGVQMSDGTHSAYQVFRLDTGALGATAAVTGVGWTNLRSSIAPLGNGWYLCSITARKVGSATSLLTYINTYNADSVATFLGDGSSGTYAWRPTLYYGSFPTQLLATTSSTGTGTAPDVGALYLKGLPVSTAGLLLPGDFVEINRELKMITASLDSDAAGRGLIRFRPGMGTAASNNQPVIVHNPLGHFMLTNDPDISVLFGTQDDVELDLLEVYP